MVALEVLFSIRKGKKASNFFNTFKKTPQILNNIEVKDKSIINNIKVKNINKKSKKNYEWTGKNFSKKIRYRI